VDTERLAETAAQLDLLGNQITTFADDAGRRVRAAGAVLGDEAGGALLDTWHRLYGALTVLADGYRTYAGAFGELAGRYDELDRTVVPDYGRPGRLTP
jgi:hypothetical protein